MADSEYKKRPTSTSASVDAVLRGIVIFLVVALACDGVRHLGKIPGQIPAQDFKIEKADKTEIFTVQSFIGHASFFFRLPSDVIDVGGNKISATHADIGIDYDSPKEHIHASFRDNTDATDKYELVGHCLKYGKQIFGIEVALAVIFMVCTVCTLFAVAYIEYKNRKNVSPEAYPMIGWMLMFVAQLLILYVILKAARIGMETETFANTHVCFNKAFEERGKLLIDNFFDIDHLKQATDLKATDTTIRIASRNWDSMKTFALVDGIHVLFLLVFLYLEMFHEMLYSATPEMVLRLFKKLGPKETKGPMGSTHADFTMTMQNEALETLMN